MMAEKQETSGAEKEGVGLRPLGSSDLSRLSYLPPVRGLPSTKKSSTKVGEGQKTSGTEDYDLGEQAVETSH